MIDEAATSYDRLTRVAQRLRVIARVVELHRDGDTNRTIAMKLQLCEDTVANYLRAIRHSKGTAWAKVSDGP